MASATPNRTNLSRKLGLLPLAATGICSMLGASVYIVPIMIQHNVPGIGPYVLPAFLLAAVPALLAAFAGIAWYLIFMRWSYRHQHGRDGEMAQTTEVEITDAALIVRRGLIETRIDWDAIDEIKSTRSYTLVLFEGAEPLMLPHDWFGEKTACEIFMKRLGQCMKSG